LVLLLCPAENRVSLPHHNTNPSAMRTHGHRVSRKQRRQMQIDPEVRNGLRADEDLLNGNDFG
jgi:hypothetical protein